MSWLSSVIHSCVISGVLLTSTVEERSLENNKAKDVLRYDFGTNLMVNLFFFINIIISFFFKVILLL